MNIFKERRSTLVNELPSIVYLSVVQLWWNFNWPSYVRLGYPLSLIVGIALSILMVPLIVDMFTDIESYSDMFSLKFLDDEQHPEMIKKIFHMCMLIIFNGWFLYLYHIDFFGMSHWYYLLFMLHCKIWIVLLYRAYKRNRDKTSQVEGEKND